MFLTREILEQYGACGKGFDFFNKHFPNGAEIIDLINMPHMPPHFLHWGYTYLPVSAEEKKAYFKKIEVVNSQSVSNSCKVKDSFMIKNSERVEGSEYIEDSQDIKNSYQVQDSHDVEGGADIFKSGFIFNSSKVANSTNISDSFNIVESSNINSSKSLVRTNLASNSTWISWSENVVNCIGLIYCDNIKNSMFCSGVSGKYLLFNKPIDPSNFEYLQKSFYRMKPTELNLLTEEGHPNLRLESQYNGVPENILRWIKALPGYDPFIMATITGLKTFIDDIK